MKKTKICFFVPFYPLVKGGAEYQSKIIANELVKLNYEVVYISTSPLKEEVLIFDNYKIYSLKVVASFTEKLFIYKKLSDKVEKILNKEKPDIVYQRILNTFTIRLSQVLKKRRIPFILHIADNYSVEFSNNYKGVLKKYFFKKILKNKPLIICQTKYQFDKVKEFNYTPESIISNMHPLIVDKVDVLNKKNVVWVGNARPVKQLEVYLDLAESFKSQDIVFNVIGNIGNDEYGNKLKNQLKKSNNVVFHGLKDNVFINKFLLKSSLLINTSVSEGFSNTFIQSWMCGTPVLSLNSDPNNVIQENNLGKYCNGSFDLMKKYLEDIIYDANFDKTCLRCYQQSIKLFSVKENIYDIKEIIEKNK
ncbi:glycosyltransferase [Aquimarina sp. TRL1]|uniref:glycosyltransferase family 4 protein n=1 Tax=Aquimarina sp. (strain TRL1) TaxID=2736252 RepID=UPI00158997A0|nr:glycosyltransferase [Aquimarina sp. TRL1]QKX04715.1 glycosyltransferase [Aquimarina sp. TRL1]